MWYRMENTRYSVRPSPSLINAAKPSRAHGSSVHIVVEPDITVKEEPEESESEPHCPTDEVEHDPLTLKLPPYCPTVVHATSDSSSVVLTNMAQYPGREQPLLMECEVKLERITDHDEPHFSNDIEFALENMKSDTKKSYECDVCCRRFALQSELWGHAMFCMPVSLRDEESVERVIPDNITIKGILQQPSSSHTKTGSETKRKNATKYTLLATGEKLYTCEICAKEFKVARNLNKHKRIHTGIKPFTCEICHRKFTQTCNLKTHLLVHSEVKQFSCEMCESKFTQLGNLKRHISRAHTKVQDYPCEICKKKFTELVTLEKHSKTHAGAKIFPCDVCNKKFTQKGNMETHKRIHTGEKPFSCDVCDRNFTALGNLLRHKLVHKKIRPFECGICKKSFKRSERLHAHTQIHSRLKGPSKDICGKARKPINVKKRIKG